VLRRPLLFPGQASQFVGMGQELLAADPPSREFFAAAEAASGLPLGALCLAGPLERLTETRHAQPAILAVSLACYAYLARRGLAPSVVAGHSLGEYSALAAAGVLAPLDALRLVTLRGRLMFASGEQVPGTMAAVLGLDREAVERCCAEAAQGEVLALANINSEDQLVISGAVAAIARGMAACSAAGAAKVVALTVSGAFHSALMAPAAEELAAALRETPFADAQAPVIPNVTAAPETSGARLRELLIEQLTRPVRWLDSMQALRRLDGADPLELGPGKVLMGLMRKIDREARVSALGDKGALDAWLAAQASTTA
jgi:[acyl-carrier-protein] S-malonyltransferase